MKRAREIVSKKAREALDASDGNKHEAALLLQVWAEADDALFRALASPLMRNLTALAIQREVSGEQAKSSAKSTKQRSGRIAEADILAALGSRQGHASTSNRAAPPPPQGSARHKQAVSILAAAYRRKPGA
jgi:hypothetical protein